MTRAIHRLPKTYMKLRPGIWPDGGCLFLQVTEGRKGNVRRSWLFKYELDGKRHEMGLGSCNDLPLADAREEARLCRLLLKKKKDPLEERKAEQAANLAATRQRKAQETKVMTFREAAKMCIAAHRPGWKNAKHAAQWTSTLETYAFPHLGALSVADIETPHVIKVLRPIWHEKTETARRVRGRIESVLAWATVTGHRKGDNPARWRGHLEQALSGKTKVQHHNAMSYNDLPQFMQELRNRDSISARALEFTVLAVTRTSETLNAEWNEIDFEKKVWTIPASRMKAGREHRVPLTSRMVEILKSLPRERNNNFVFFGTKRNKPLSNMSMLQLLRGMRPNLTVHGFRSSFRDWAGETTNYPREVAEMALAHAVGGKVEAAYRRGDLFEKRQRLMAEWSRFCQSTPAATAAVVPIRA